MKRFIDQLSSYIVIGGGYAASGMIALMCVMVSYEVIARWIFASPTVWSVELTSYALAIMTFLGAGYVLYVRRHVRVVVLLERLSGRSKDVLELIATVIGLIFSLTVLWKGVEWVLETYRLGEVSPTVLLFPQWIIRLSFPIGLALLCVQFIKKGIAELREITRAHTGKNS